MSDIELPDIPTGAVVVELSTAQIRQIYDRIELIDSHFAKCCAFQLDQCKYGDEYNSLYGYLHLAGVDAWKTPFDRDEFEEWLTARRVREGSPDDE